jgi:hypothetical protein
MRTVVVTMLLVFVGFGSSVFAWGRRTHLRLDYARQREWSYTMDYRAQCVIDEGGRSSNLDSRIVCRLSGTPTAGGSRLTFTIDSAAMNSQLYEQEQEQAIIGKLTDARLGLALIRGCPVVDTLSTFSAGELSEWDLVIQFARLLPDVPTRPVRAGYEWERSGVHPIETSLGKIPCEVYRAYRLDSLSRRGDSAYISWRFRYAAADLAVDTSAILKRVPVSGTGNGTAVIDVEEQALLRAEVRFRTPLASVGDTRVYWTDRTVLLYQPPPGRHGRRE